ncbi:MAG: Wzz/FepE/Etk N-terminal domain-containing protein [Bacteroidales bacterium]|nr:lipopolysaccharide biosynthesis protein [Bacteroidales bacterium]
MMQDKQINESAQINSATDEEDEIDLMAIAKTLWKGRLIILISVVIGAFLGVLVAFNTPNEYIATTIMVPQLNSSSKSQLSGLASLAGLDLGMTQSSDLSPVIYPQIVNSNPFKLELMNTKFNFSEFDKPITLLEYYTNEKKLSVIGAIKKYTIGLPGVLLKALKNKSSKVDSLPGNLVIRPLELSKDQTKVKKILDKVVSLAVEKKEGYLTLNVTMPEALAAAQVAEKAQELLQRDITRFKIEKAQADLNFIQERYNIAKAQAEGYQVKVAVNTDKFKDLVSAVPEVANTRLQTKYGISSSVFQELAKQLEQAKIQVSKDTPVFTVIEPVAIPSEKSKPNKPMILILWVFLGCVVGVGIVMGKHYFSEIKQKWNAQ